VARKRLRIAIVTEIPAPFRTPIFNALAARDDVELRVLFLAATDPRRSYAVRWPELQFPYEVLRGKELRRGGRWVVLTRGLVGALRRFDPHLVVVGGWNQPACWEALAWTRLKRRPLVAWVESTVRDERPGSPPLEWLKRALVRASAGFLVPGRASAEYLAGLGSGARPVEIAPNAVDTRHFGEAVADARRERDALRAELGVTGCVVLCVARLAPEKNVGLLLEAFGRLGEGALVIAGSGEERARLERDAPPGTRFTGWLEREQLVRWYAAADVLVSPSRSEQWGFALNEAAAAGLPLVTTTAVGAARELVEDGVNGFVVEPDDVDGLAAALRRLADDPALRERAGARSRELAATHTPEAWAEAVARLASRLCRR
jgi:glycosyltransferase involved in cell wall biosynthesis